MNRETKTITTPADKKEIVLNSWITGREKRELKRIFLEQTNAANTAEENKKKMNVADLVEKAENRAIEMIVVSVDGKKEKIVDEILNMKAKDYDFVISEINKVSKETDFLV